MIHKKRSIIKISDLVHFFFHSSAWQLSKVLQNIPQQAVDARVGQGLGRNEPRGVAPLDERSDDIRAAADDVHRPGLIFYGTAPWRLQHRKRMGADDDLELTKWIH